MTEDEGGPKPIPEDPERDPAGTTGGEPRETDEASSAEPAGQPGEDGRAIDVDLAHDRAS